VTVDIKGQADPARHDKEQQPGQKDLFVGGNPRQKTLFGGQVKQRLAAKHHRQAGKNPLAATSARNCRMARIAGTAARVS